MIEKYKLEISAFERARFNCKLTSTDENHFNGMQKEENVNSEKSRLIYFCVMIGKIYLVFSHIVCNINKMPEMPENPLPLYAFTDKLTCTKLKRSSSASVCLYILNNPRVHMQQISNKSNNNYNLTLIRTCSVFFRSFLTTGFSKYPFECLSF